MYRHRPALIRRRLVPLAAGLALAWLGLCAHNLADLPGLTLLDPAYSLPAALSIRLFAGWWLAPSRLTRALIRG